MILGCIGDDFTGSSDIANTLSREGMRVIQYVGIPQAKAASDVEAGVISLKSRTCPPDEAVSQSLAAAEWLLAQGATKIVFKYCSTFDSTPGGNIGPVTEALAKRLGETHVVMCPAFPANQRTVYQGHLFVGDTLLSESGMQDHPLTPMTDPDIRRVLARQTKMCVSHLPWQTVCRGAGAVRDAIDRLPAGMIIADAIVDADLRTLGEGTLDRKLITGGSGIALGLPALMASGQSRIASTATRRARGKGDDKGIVLCGSCSGATRGQIEAWQTAGRPVMQVSTDDLVDGTMSAANACRWASEQGDDALIYTSASPQDVARAQREHGAQKVADTVEGFFAGLARELAGQGFTRMVIAGGETSGAVVLALDITALEIGPEIAPGVPAMRLADSPMRLALKSGNFGGPDFFSKALGVLHEF